MQKFKRPGFMSLYCHWMQARPRVFNRKNINTLLINTLIYYLNWKYLIIQWHKRLPDPWFFFFHPLTQCNKGIIFIRLRLHSTTLDFCETAWLVGCLFTCPSLFQEHKTDKCTTRHGTGNNTERPPSLNFQLCLVQKSWNWRLLP